MEEKKPGILMELVYFVDACLTLGAVIVVAAAFFRWLF